MTTFEHNEFKMGYWVLKKFHFTKNLSLELNVLYLRAFCFDLLFASSSECMQVYGLTQHVSNKKYSSDIQITCQYGAADRTKKLLMNE